MPRSLIILMILCLISAIGTVWIYNTYISPEDDDAKDNQIIDYDVTYRVGMDEFAPLVFFEGDELTGFDVEIIRWIGNEMKFNVELVLMPWDAVFTALETKEVDMIMSGTSITPERSQKFLFSDPYLPISQTIAVSAESTMFLDDFYTGRGIVGVELGTTSDDIATSTLVHTGILPEEKLYKYDAIDDGAVDLVNGDIQYLLCDWPVMVGLIQNYPIHIIGEIDTGEKYGIALHKDNKQLQQTINTGLHQLSSSPDWDEMKHRYLLDY